MTAPPTVLLDSNIIIDVFLKRQPFAQNADKLILLVEDGKLQASLCANSTTTADYLLYGALGKAIAHEHILRLSKIFDIAPSTALFCMMPRNQNLKTSITPSSPNQQ